MTSKRKRTYLLVIALGGAGLLVDRLIAPSSTQADSNLFAPGVEVAARTRPGATPANPQNPVELSVPELPFPRTLPQWDTGEPIRDIFSSANSNAPTEKRRARAAEAEGYGTCAHMIKSCHINALMVNERVQIAVINGERMQVGRELLGCKLFSVEGHQVRFRCADGDVGLTLTPSATGPAD